MEHAGIKGMSIPSVLLIPNKWKVSTTKTHTHPCTSANRKGENKNWRNKTKQKW